MQFSALFSSPEPKARVSYCHSAPSVVRPSVVVVRKLFTFSTSSPKPLDGFWWNLVGMKYSWSLTSVVVFRPGANPGWGQNRSRGVPFFKKLLLQTGRLQRQTKCIAVTRSMWEEVLLLLVPFRSQIFDAFLTSFWTSSFCLILMQFLLIFMR